MEYDPFDLEANIARADAITAQEAAQAERQRQRERAAQQAQREAEAAIREQAAIRRDRHERIINGVSGHIGAAVAALSGFEKPPMNLREETSVVQRPASFGKPSGPVYYYDVSYRKTKAWPLMGLDDYDLPPVPRHTNAVQGGNKERLILALGKDMHLHIAYRRKVDLGNTFFVFPDKFYPSQRVDLMTTPETSESIAGSRPQQISIQTILQGLALGISRARSGKPFQL